VANAPITPAAFQPETPLATQYKAILGRDGFTVLLTILLNIYGTLWLVGGALWSAWLFWRKRVLLNRALGNVLIGVGAFLPASAGTLIKLGLADWLSLSQLLGAVLMFIGFTLTTLPQSAERAAPPASA
jgi:hypothetical protein